MPDPLPLHFAPYVYANTPTLVPGGGAEVVPAANAAWFANNGFQPAQTHQAYFPPQTETDYHQQQEEPASAPFQFDVPPSQPVVYAPQQVPPPQLDLKFFTARQNAPFPIYSASGFDFLSILARVATRPNPRVVLGPVDLTCAFVVVDVRRYDHPIVYCSPTFCALTGYAEHEVVGRNCRFLQAPGGGVRKGEQRTYTEQEGVARLRKHLVADKECQAVLTNYRKDGSAFRNLVTVIPVLGGVSGALHEEQECVYHVGFQVDVDEQPEVYREKMRDGGGYAVHSHLNRVVQPPHPHPHPGGRERKVNAIPPIVMSKELRRLLADPAFLRSVHITTSTTLPAPPSSASASSAAASHSAAGAASHEDAITGGTNHLLHLVLLELAPAFVHVVSLKGDFLYVGPSVRRVLGYEPEEMVGASIARYAHPEDVVPLMRELKESSAMGAAGGPGGAGSGSGGGELFGHGLVGATGNGAAGKPRAVDLLFRAKTKMGRYVWVECRGRLHVEPGKGRKAIILSGRAREMMNLKWEDVNRAGGLAQGVRVRVPLAQQQQVQVQVQEVPLKTTKDGKHHHHHHQQAWRTVEQEVWGMLGGEGKETMVFASVGRGVEDVLGWTEGELLGRSVLEVLLDEGAANVIGGFVATMRAYQKRCRLPSLRRALGLGGAVLDAARVKKARAPMRRKDGGVADVWFIVYRADPDYYDLEERESGDGDERREREMTIAPAPLVYQIRLVDAATVDAGKDSGISVPPMGKSAASPTNRPSPSSSSSTSSSSSSLAGAVQPSPVSPSTTAASPPAAHASTSTATTTTPSVDMFEELAIARGSSWQYELQQLRFANVRLQEELAALEAAAEVGGVGGGWGAGGGGGGGEGGIVGGGGGGGTEASVSPPRDPPPAAQPQDVGIPPAQTGGYSFVDASSFAAYMDQTFPSPHLFMQRALPPPPPPPQQQQQHQPHLPPPPAHQYLPPPMPPPAPTTTTASAYAPQHQHQQNQPHSQSPYSIQAMPGVAPLQNLQHQHQHQHQVPVPQQQRRTVPPPPRHQHMPMPPSVQQVQQDWNGVMTTAPLGSVSVSGYVGMNGGNGGSALKRPWDAVEP